MSNPLVKADCKIIQTSLHAREGDPAYIARAVFEVLEINPETHQYVLAGGDAIPDSSIWLRAPGQAWAKQADVPTTEGIRTLLEASDGRLYAGTIDPPGVWISEDYGLSWRKVGALGAAGLYWGVYSMVELDDTGTLLAGTYPNHQVWRSTDGYTWTYVQQLGSVAGFDYVHNLVQAANGDILASVEDVTVGGQNAEIWRSQDDGLTWSLLTTIAATKYLYGMTVLETGTIIAGQFQTALVGKFYRSTDNGATWASAGNCTGNDNPWCFVVLDDGTILSGTVQAGGLAEVWRSTNDGATWAKLSNVSAEEMCFAMALGHDGDVFAGVSASWPGLGTAEIWRSTDDGASWEKSADMTDYFWCQCMLRVGA